MPRVVDTLQLVGSEGRDSLALEMGQVRVKLDHSFEGWIKSEMVCQKSHHLTPPSPLKGVGEEILAITVTCGVQSSLVPPISQLESQVLEPPREVVPGSPQRALSLLGPAQAKERSSPTHQD
eukprot:Gb_26099 [translate_table: standard]